MGVFTKRSRIFKFVLVIGMAIIFLAVLMVLLGSNATADVIVDQGGNGDYPTIQEGIDNAIPGENVFVWDGSYNENITIDKSIQLIGNGSTSTRIDGFGTMNNIINVTAEGVEITGFNITESGMWYGIWANVGGFNIHDNVFSTQNYAIYVDISRISSGSIIIGDMIVDNNEVNGTDGFFFKIDIRKAMAGSDIVIGQTMITNNKLYDTNTGILLDDYEVSDMSGGSIDWADVVISDNLINSNTDEGIDFWGWVINMTDVNIDLGNLDFSGNNITSDVICMNIVSWNTIDLFGTTDVMIQDTTLNNNTIVSLAYNGIVLYTSYYFYMNDFAYVTTGDFNIISNNVTALGFGGQGGICIYMIGIGQGLQNDASVYFGNMYVDSNIVTAVEDGILIEILDSGRDIHNNSIANVGNIFVTNNDINSSKNGVHLKMDNVGFANDGFSSATFGNFIISDNDILSIENGTSIEMNQVCYDMVESASFVMGSFSIDSNNITSITKGIKIQGQDIVRFMYDDAVFSIGDFAVNYNTINSTNSKGIEFIIQYSAVTMNGNASATFGNFLFIENNITSFTDGIWFGMYDFGFNMHDRAVLTTKDFILNDNLIKCGSVSNVIVLDFFGIGNSMYGDSFMSLGSGYIEDNIIFSGGLGIYVVSQNWGNDMEDNSNMIYGDILIHNNDVNVTGHRGISIYHYDIGKNLLDFSSVVGGNISIINNNVSSQDENGLYLLYGGTGYNLNDFSFVSMGWIDISFNNFSSINNHGAYISISRLGYQMYGNSQAYFGDIMFTNNNVRSDTMDAVHFYQFYQNAYLMYDNSYIQIGNFLVNDNNLSAGGTGDGIELFQWTDNAFEMYYNVSAYFGNFEFQRNSIKVKGSGIKITDLGWLGIYLNGTSTCAFGDFIIEDNTINASNDGLYINAWDWGETLSHNGSVTFGDFSVSNNIIESGYRGIFFQLDPAAYDMFDMARFEMGSIIVSNNTILSGIDPASINSYGISIWTRSVGYEMHHESQVIIGSILVNDNDITVLFGTNTDGINIYRISRYANYMYDSASFTMNGNLEVCRNTVNTTNGDNGIYCDFYENGYYLYDDSTAYYGDFLFNENTISSGGDGIYINSFQMCGSYVYNNSVASFGDIEINDNQIIAGLTPSGFNRGIYFYFYENCYDVSGNPQVYFGHILINDNTIICYDSHGIYVDAFYEIGANYMQDNAYFEMGNFEVQRNWIDANESGIYILELAMLGYEIQDNSSAVFGDFLFDANTIYAGADGIYINAFDWARTMTGTSSATFGDFSVSNNIIESGNQGIYLQFEYAGYDMHDMTRFEMGSIRILNNTIISGQDPASVTSYGILFHSRYVGYDMRNESQAIVGPILVNENTVTVVFGTNSQAIYINWISDYGAYMYDTAIFSMNGNIEVCRNTLNTTNGEEAIFCDVYNLGNYLYGDNTASYGNILFNDNIIIDAYNQGMYILVNAIGYYTYGNSSVTIGNVELNNNDILFANGGYFTGIDFRLYDLGASMYDGSIFNMGQVQMNDNIIDNPYGMGLYIEAYRLGYQMYNSSSAYFGNFEYLRNNIASYDEGINLWYFQNFASNIYHNTTAIFGDFIINNNVINTTSIGADGIYIENFHNIGYQMNDGARFEMGDFNIKDNTINARDNGIYFEPAYFGAYMYGNSTAIIGNNFITGNEINVADGYGLYAWWWYEFAYEMHNNSMCMVGDSVIMYNVINVTGGSGISGIYTGPYDSGENVYDSSTAIFGDYIVSYNTINTVDVHGIQFSIYRVGYNMDGFASVTTGNISVSNNIINSINNNGINIIDTYQNGYELYDNAKVTMGMIEFIDNHIEVGSNGITSNSIYDFGSHMFNNSKFEMGDFNFIDNIITANFNGIYFEPYYFGAFMEDNSIAIIGNNFFTGNEINVADGYGLYAWWWYWFAYEMYDNSTCTVGDSVIMDNVINVTGSGMYGIWTGPYDSGENVHGNITAIFGDYIVSHNTIIANNSYGIEFDIYQTGYEMYDNSNVTFGQFQINDNNITTPNGAGLFVNFDTLAYNVYNNSYLSLDDIMISNNIISAQTIGLDIQYEDCGGLYHTSTAYLPGIQILGNWVDSAISAFNYTTINTPSHNDPGATQVWGDVILDGNDFDAGAFGAVLDWQDPNASVAQPVFYIQNTKIHNGLAGSTGLVLINITDVYADHVTIDTFDYGIFANNSIVHHMLNGSIANCAVLDISLYSSSFLFMINSTFDNSSVFFEDFDSLLEVAWFMNVQVQSQVPLPIPDAIVAVADIDGTEIFSGLTNGDGQAFYIICMDYEQNITGIIKNYNDYTANATKGVDFGVASPDPTMNRTQVVIITFIDVTPPTIFGDNSDTSGTTGDPFYFEINASDNMGIVSVRLNYRFNGTGPYINLTMNGTGPYWLDRLIPSDQLGFIEYYFTALDSGGFWVNTTLTTAPITDNDAPTFVWISQPMNGTTGESTIVSIQSIDNIGITYYKIDVDGVLYDLVKDGDYYNFTFDVPPDSVADIIYSIILNDSANNPNTIPGTTITVSDNDPPTLVVDNSDITATTGDQFHYEINIIDNIGINQTNFIYWFGSDPFNIIVFFGPGPWGGNISVPIDSLETLHYKIASFDFYGNWYTLPQVNISVIDNDAPELIWISQPTSGTPGESVLVSIMATDNIGVANYTITINGTTYDMVKDGDYYNYTYMIPNGSSLDISYSVTFSDAAGNSNTTLDTLITITGLDFVAPTYTWIEQPTSGTTGESVFISLMATDDSGIIYYKIEIDGVLYDLTKDGDYYNFTINIPGDSLTGVTYKVIFNDTANNANITSDTTIIITDNDDPLDLVDDSDTTATTGDSFTFEFDASDNIGLAEAEIFYWFGTGSETSEVVTGSGPFTFTITVPSDSLDELHYYVVIEDAAGNELTGSTNDITVTDNDNPFDIIDNSQDTATTGDDFTFNVNASDNIGIVEVEIYYWFGDGDETELSITGSGPFTHTITLPTDSTETLHYYFVIIDAADNELIGSQVDVTITDNDPATISNDQTDTTPEVGEELTFQINASDNIGVSQVRVAYWFGDDETQKQFITLTEEIGTFSGSFTPEESGTLNYYFEVTDSAGNIQEGSQQSAQIASEPEEEEEPVILPWILIVIIIIVIVLFFFLMSKKGKDEEDIPKVEDDLEAEEAEPEGEVLEEGEAIDVDSVEEPIVEEEMGEDVEVVEDPEVVSEEPTVEEVESEEPKIEEVGQEEPSIDEEPKDDIDRSID
jgi:hypothetical protein